MSRRPLHRTLNTILLSRSATWLSVGLIVAGGLCPVSADSISGKVPEMPLKFKTGVNQSAVVPEMVLGIQVVCSIFDRHNLDCIITSMHDGKHGERSLHSRDGLCRAVDFRTKHIATGIQKTMIIDGIKEALGRNYDVVFEDEGDANEHLHVEWDRKVQV